MSYTTHAKGILRYLVVSAAAFVALMIVTQIGNVPKAYAADCGPNAIIYCGFNDNNQLVGYLTNNQDTYPRTPHTDLQVIMEHFGLNPSEYERFRTSARDGIVYKDGRIVVGGQTVATNVNSIGRTTLDGRHDKSMSIGGKTYYYGAVTRVFRSPSIPAKVLFDSQGRPETTLLTDCGNPVWGTPVTSTVTCSMLKKTPVDGSADTFSFTTGVAGTGNASIIRCEYDWGDGSQVEHIQDCASPIKHTFKPGTWTAKVTVVASVPGGSTITSKQCQQSITVAPPVVLSPGIKIEKKVNDTKTAAVEVNKNFTYKLIVTNTGNTDLNDIAVDEPSPHVNMKLVSATPGTIVNNSLRYTISSLGIKQSTTITITAVMTQYAAGPIVNKACVDAPSVPGSPDACDTATVTVKKPSVTITKVVNDKKDTAVAVGEAFTYTLQVTNNGESALTNVQVTDAAPKNVTFVSATPGTIKDNALVYTIPTLAVRQTVAIKITAKATTYVSGSIKNTACVNAPAVNPATPKDPDACDDATITLKMVPYYQCVELSGPQPEGYTYTFVAKLNYGNGAVLTSVDFSFGDGATAARVKPGSANAMTVSTKHTYGRADTYSVSATARFTVDGKEAIAPTCSAVIKPTAPPVPECKPGIPVGDVKCNPCPYDASLTADNPNCKAPVKATTLPNTGAGNVIAVGVAALVAGFLFYRHQMFKKHQAEAYQAEVGASPLPLADPLAEDNPLAETPLQPHMHRSTFRRRRQF